jgi:hypothetical protein
MQFSWNPLARERMISRPGHEPRATQTDNGAVERNGNSVADHEVLLPPHLRRRLQLFGSYVGSIWKALK